MPLKYLSEIIISTTRRYVSRNSNNIPLVRVSNNYFMNTFFQSIIKEWNNLDLSICYSTNIFNDILLQFVKQFIKQCLYVSEFYHIMHLKECH